MNTPKMRAWWSHRQGLDGSLRNRTPSEVLERTGWSRSVGGVGPYLTIFSRAGASREVIDAAAASLDIQELPAARGCTYVLPRTEYALGLAVGRDFGNAEMKLALKLGVTESEVDTLCEAVLKALDNGPLEPDAIRTATGNASRSLGEEGKKKGLTTTLPLAIGRLQVTGDIRRIPVSGQFASQRYKYARWSPNPLGKQPISVADAYVQVACKFFTWVGPATVSELQVFLGLGVKATKDIVAKLDVQPTVENNDRLLLADDVSAFREFEAPTIATYALVSSLDPILANRRNVESLLDDKDRERTVDVETRSKSISSLVELPSHAILDRGRLVGLWEYDTASSSIVYATFGVKRNAALTAAVEEAESFIRDQVGDARSFSLDSPKSRGPRIAALREMLSVP